MHVDHFCHFAERQGLEVLDSLLKEFALPLDDVVHHLEHRLTTLLDRLDHPVGGIELVGDELLVLTVELLFVPRDLLIRSTELESWQIRVVQEDMIPVIDLFDDQIGDDLVVIARSELEPGLRIELRDFVRRLLNIGGADSEPFGYLAPAVVD